MSNQNQVVSYIDKLPTIKIAEDPAVVNKFVSLYKNIHKRPGMSDGEALELANTILAKEQFNFMKLVSENESLRKASNLSLYGCFLDVAVNGLSLEQGNKPHCYMMTRNIKVKKADNSEGWETRAYVQISPYGELLMRMRAGHIKRADNPVIVYEGDKIRVGLNAQGHKVVLEYETMIPRQEGARIIGGFIRLERHDGAFECPWVDVAEMERLASYSNKNNKGDAVNNKANALYYSNNGQIDPGFFEAKIIKHAFRSYPKVRIGEFSALATEFEESKEQRIDYGLSSHTEDEKAEVVKDDMSFAAHAPQAEPATVVIQPTADDESF